MPGTCNGDKTKVHAILATADRGGKPRKFDSPGSLAISPIVVNTAGVFLSEFPASD